MGKKDNIIRRVEGIDEKQLLESMADFGQSERKKEVAPAVEENQREEPEPEERKISTKSKAGSAYQSVFLQPKELKTRQCVYIGQDLHEKIIAIVNEIAVKGMSVGAFIDTILREHLEEHKEEINSLYRRKRGDLL